MASGVCFTGKFLDSSDRCFEYFRFDAQANLPRARR